MKMPKVKIISISAKSVDLFWASYQTASGAEVGQRDGYTPKFFPGEHYGDYVMLDIDVDTGKILNWKKPSQGAIQKDLEENPVRQ
jgi:hypothetical protein